MNLRYVALRSIRHFVPERVARFLLKKRWIIHPGLESTEPIAAAARYVDALVQHGKSIGGQRVLVFGYGGSFAVGVELLRQGAGQVVLCDHLALLDHARNRSLLPRYQQYLALEGNEVKPRSHYMTLLHGDIRAIAERKQVEPVDCVLSRSVFEHLDDVEGITRAVALLTKPDGVHVHFVDLRDHYFKLPFEMLTHSQRAWDWFFNPPSNLNRYRLRDYQAAFDACFRRVEIQIQGRDEEAFAEARPRIYKNFLSNDASQDSVTVIRILATGPLV